MTEYDPWTEVGTRELVPWVGAGVSNGLRRERTDEPLVPTWHAFLTTTAGEFAPAIKPEVDAKIESGMMSAAAALLKDALGVTNWHERLRSTFEVELGDIDEAGRAVLRAIWRISSGLVLTTNYDDTLRWLPDQAAPPMPYGLHSTPDLSTLLGATPENPRLWQLHGAIQHPDTLVIAEAEYDRLYGRDPLATTGPDPGDGRERILDAALLCLKAIVASRNILFIGFSFRDERVNRMLADVHRLFPETRAHHFATVSERSHGATRDRLRAAGIDGYVTLLPVPSLDTDLAPRLEALREARAPRERSTRIETKWQRRRCRTIVAGSPEFVRDMMPLIGESAPHVAASILRDMQLERALSPFEAAFAKLLELEFDGKTRQLVTVGRRLLQDPGIQGVEQLNLMLLFAIGLEKDSLAGAKEAIGILDEIIGSDCDEELRFCAEFNREVCREKLDLDADFTPYLHDRTRRLASGELLWPKAWGMELVRAGRTHQEFDYADLLENVLAVEVDEASTGVGKSIANWGHYSGEPIDQRRVDQLNEIARTATPTQRIPFLIYLARATDEPRFRDAIRDAIEQARDNPTLLRLVQTERVRGRYTLYGEFLMHELARGYVAPVPMFLQGTYARPEDGTTWVKDGDTVSAHVASLGLDAMPTVLGDLPFGQGFASSTVLAMLHLGGQRPSDLRSVVNFLDWMSHGFEPSGMDHDAIKAQAPGLFRAGEWKTAPPIPLHALFYGVEGGRTISLKRAQELVLRQATRLVPLANQLTAAILDENRLDLEAFAKYCETLCITGVYTEVQLALIERAKTAGLHAKGIGGLHAKAILVVGDPDALEAFTATEDQATLLGELHPEV